MNKITVSMAEARLALVDRPGRDDAGTWDAAVTIDPDSDGAEYVAWRGVRDAAGRRASWTARRAEIAVVAALTGLGAAANDAEARHEWAARQAVRRRVAADARATRALATRQEAEAILASVDAAEAAGVTVMLGVATRHSREHAEWLIALAAEMER